MAKKIRDRRYRVLPYAQWKPVHVSAPASEPDEVERLAILLKQREDELDEAYGMVSSLSEAYEKIHARYRRLSSYLLKLEMELHAVNNAHERRAHSLPAAGKHRTMDDLMGGDARKEYVLEEREGSLVRVKKKK